MLLYRNTTGSTLTHTKATAKMEIQMYVLVLTSDTNPPISLITIADVSVIGLVTNVYMQMEASYR